MSDLFDFMPKTGTTHVVLPNMATACGLDLLTARDAGDAMTYKLQATRDAITCPWCRSLGTATRRHLAAVMQGRQATITD